MAEKKKPVKISWAGGLADSGAANSESERVAIRSGERREKEEKLPRRGKVSVSQCGDGGGNGGGEAALGLPRQVTVRLERKGRAGHPVLVIGGCASSAQAEMLLARLKPQLGCGGTVEGAEVVVQIRDQNRLREALRKLGVSGG